MNCSMQPVLDSFDVGLQLDYFREILVNIVVPGAFCKYGTRPAVATHQRQVLVLMAMVMAYSIMMSELL